MSFRTRLAVGLVLVAAGAFAATALGGYRPFAFSYDTYPMPQGQVEFEQWVTYKTHTRDEPGFARFDFREEVEMGLAENFRLGLYLPKWVYEDTNAHTGTRFDTVGAEGILLLSNPTTDFLGFGLYAEVNVGAHEVEFENKLLLQKDIGNWTLAYNLVVENEIEGIASRGPAEVNGVLGHTFGASYSLGPAWRVGGEMIIESEYANWNHYEGTTVYAGPNISYQGGNIGQSNASWWMTITPVVQLTDEDPEPDYQVRMIAGVEF